MFEKTTKHSVKPVHEIRSERRDAERKTLEKFRQPRRLCREYALEDGRKSRAAAAVLVQKRKYREARARLEDAQTCFNWADGAEMEVRELQRLLEEVEVSKLQYGYPLLGDGASE